MSQEMEYNFPKNIKKHKGEFVVFFPEESKPEVLFHTFKSEEAYKEAENIQKQKGKAPVVKRVLREKTNLSKLISLRM